MSTIKSIYEGYIIIELFLIIFTFAIKSRLNSYIGSLFEVSKLKSIIYVFWISIASDMMCAAIMGKMFSPPELLYAFVIAAKLITIVIGCFLWFQFVDSKLDGSIPSIPKRIICVTPLTIAVLSHVISIFARSVFYIDDSGMYHHGKLFIIQELACYIYMAIPTLKAVSCYFKLKSRSQRQDCIVYASYMLPAVIAYILEDRFPSVPVLYMSIFMVINVLFISIQDQQIYNDALTGMNNRKRMTNFILNKLENVSEKAPLMVFMVDIDKFKQINDNFGHVEGDSAIIIVVRAVSKTAGKFGGLAARYGGDEFCLILDKNGCNEGQIIRHMRSVLRELSKDKKDYTIEISIGCCICDDPDMTPEDLIMIADEELYKDKEANRLRRAS